MKKFYFVACFFVATSFVASAQGELPVSMHDGRALISVPVYSIEAGEASVGISLGYDASGVKVGAPGGFVGINWNLNGISKITREVRGLPDDFRSKGVNRRFGWLYDSSGVKVNVDIATLPNTADQTTTTCADENADYAKIQSWIDKRFDTEMDLFHYQLGDNLSGSFVFDNSATPTIRLIPYRDIIIKPIFYSATDKKLTGFIIKTNTGGEFTFNLSQNETRNITSSSAASYQYEDFRNFSNATITYGTTWHLSKAKSANGEEVSYQYGNSEPYTTTTPMSVKIKSSSDYIVKPVYTYETSGTRVTLSSIVSSSGVSMLFTKTGTKITKIEIYDSRNGDHSAATTRFVKEINLTYLGEFLQTVQEKSGTEQLPPYSFEYNGSNGAAENSKSVDFWGYFNGAASNADKYPTLYIYPQLASEERIRLFEIPGYSGPKYTIPGANRLPHPEFVKMGSLSAITFPWGGRTDITYEANDFYDAVAGVNYPGAGIRVKSVLYQDGTNLNAKIRKNFTYKDALNRSTGVLTMKPVFAMNIVSPFGLTPDDPQNNLSEWEYYLARTEVDISGEGASDIVYKEVKVARPDASGTSGAGYAVYEYDVPATWGSASTGDWTPTANKLVRSASCPVVLSITDLLGTWKNPYTRHPNLGHERGLEKFKREYAQNGTLVRLTVTTYQYLYKQGTTPHKVWGVAYGKLPEAATDMYMFGNYYLLTDMARVVAQQTVTTYDATDANKKEMVSAQYFYESSAHKLLTRMTQTTADGAVYTTRTRYPLDYGTIPAGADAMGIAIDTLQRRNVNGIAIEQYVTLSRDGGAEKVTGGSITKFSDFGIVGKVLPQYSLVWRSDAPVLKTSYTESYVHASTKAFTTDGRYEVVNTVLSYDSLHLPSAQIGEDRIPVSTLWSSILSAPVATVVDALPGEYAMTDMEAGTEASFNLVSLCMDCGPNPAVQKSIARSGYWGLSPEVKMSKTVSKGAEKYKLTGWWNKHAATLSITVKIMNTAKTVTHYTQTYGINAANDDAPWDFFSLDVPLSGAGASFYVEITYDASGTGPFGTLSGSIDDIAFYPEQASMSTVTYNFPFGVSSSTMEDKSSFTDYDALGRVKYVRDKDKNIVKKNTYRFEGQ